MKHISSKLGWGWGTPSPKPLLGIEEGARKGRFSFLVPILARWDCDLGAKFPSINLMSGGKREGTEASRKPWQVSHFLLHGPRGLDLMTK